MNIYIIHLKRESMWMVRIHKDTKLNYIDISEESALKTIKELELVSTLDSRCVAIYK